MKLWPKILVIAVFGAGAVFPSRAQQQPVLSVKFTSIDVVSGSSPVTSITVTAPGVGYSTPPTVSFAGGGGAGAAGTAVISGGTVTSITITSAGSGYSAPPVITITGGGGSGAAATANLTLTTTTFAAPNEAFGPALSRVDMFALATGTFPLGGFTYTFFINGNSVGSPPNVPAPIPNGISWAPPAPGVYFFSVHADGAGPSADSLPVRYFATGAIINSPQSPTVVPDGSSVVIKADATTAQGFIQKIDFYVDGVLAGTDSTYPYSLIYAPTGTTGTSHTLTVKATDNNGNVLTSPSVSLLMTQHVGSLPTSIIATPLNASTVSIPDYVADSSANIPINVQAGASPGTITKVETYIDGILVNTGTSFPYNFAWKPTVVGTYRLTALAFDDKNNVIASLPTVVTVTTGGGGGTVIGQAPVVSITSPTTGSSVMVGNATSLTASATDADGIIASVQFFVNGVSLAAPDTTFPYSASWTPTALGSYNITAKAIDNDGNVVTSSAVAVTVGTNAAPAVVLTSPASATTVGAGTPVNLAATATDVDGTITAVRFLANGSPVGTATVPPFRVVWTPTGGGTFVITAEATDNSGNVTTSTPVNVTVTGNRAPLVSITAPATGSTTQVGTGASPVTVTASASDADGTIRSVDFYANGTLIGSRSSPPYTITWTPAAEGVYQLTAVATDNSFASTTSTAVPVLAVAASGTSAVNVFTGIYVGGAESGKFAAATLGGKFAVFIGHSTQGPVKTYFYPSLPLDTGGGFSRSNGAANLIAGSVIGTVVSGTLGTNGLFSGANPTLSGSATPFPQAGYITGSLTGRPTSSLAAIVGADGSIMLEVSDGSFSDVGDARVDSTGAFTITTGSGNTLVGKVDPATGFLSGTLTVIGSNAFTASVMGSLSSGGTFSDGVLRGLSTRGFVGTGNNVLIAGFLVDGTSPKQVIIRGIGPSLGGVSNPLLNPFLQLFNGSGGLVSSNDNWATPIGSGASAASISNATVLAGLGGLAGTSLDSVILTTLSPGAYTAQLSGVSATSGNALIEIYDLDALPAFSAQKVRALSTRGFVGTSGNELIAGFIVSGNTPKKVLIQAAGPALAGGVSGTLADPVLKIVNMSNSKTVRENDNWEVGNDSAAMVDAVNRSGATPLTAGSKDAAILISLPPGVYTAIVSGSGNTTGIALVQVYEVP